MWVLDFSWVIKGKLAGHRAPESIEDLIFLKNQGILSLVRLAKIDKAKVTNQQINGMDMWDMHEPVTDFTAPTADQIDKIIDFIDISKSAGRPVGTSCGAGLGRTGTILACYLVHQGYDASTAILEIRKLRPGSIETMDQENAIKAYAANR